MCKWLVFSLILAHVCAVFGDQKVQILHTNDMHARYLEVDENTITCTSTQARHGQCYGGFARIRQAAIKAKRAAKKQHIPTLFLNAGDTFQGTPYYSTYKWKITAPLVDSMQFDAMCLGNHEFDDGIDNVVSYLTNIKAPTITTNLDFDSEPRLNETNVKKSVVQHLKGIKIGIVGYLTPTTVNISQTENLKILDEIPSLQEEVKRLKSNGTQLIIALGHSGFLKDQEVAKEVEGIDVIIGGHSHSLLYTPTDKPPSTEPVEAAYPFWVTQKSGKKIPIVQASAFTKYLGKLILTLNDTGSVISAEGNSILLDHSYAKNIKLEKQVQSWTAELRAQLETVVGSTRVSLRASSLNSADIESTFLNLITDAFFEKGVLIATRRHPDQWTRHAVAFYLNSGVRAGIDHTRNGGNITLGDILTALPFKNPIRECRLAGSSIREALEITAQLVDPKQIKFNDILHFSGLRVVYNLNNAPKSRIHSIQIICTECSVPRFEDLDDRKLYNIITESFFLSGTHEYSSIGAKCQNEKQFDPSNPSTSDIVGEYIRKHQIIYPQQDGRMRIHGL